MDSHGFEEVLKTRLSHGERLDSDGPVAMESTGSYHINLFSFLTAQGIRTVVVNPLLISNYAKLSLRKTKTDKKDALTIARFLLDHHEEIYPQAAHEERPLRGRLLLRAHPDARGAPHDVPWSSAGPRRRQQDGPRRGDGRSHQEGGRARLGSLRHRRIARRSIARSPSSRGWMIMPRVQAIEDLAPILAQYAGHPPVFVEVSSKVFPKGVSELHAAGLRGLH